MDRETMIALAERVEALTGPDRSADTDIYCAVNECSRSHWVEDSTPEWTASLDAALTLVPEGKLWRVGTGFTYEAVAGLSHGISYHSPALALTAAALRARAQTLPQPDAAPEGGEVGT